jgi:hypothetical protein
VSGSGATEQQKSIKPGKVGRITETIIKLLNLSVAADTPVYIGQSNITHMKTSHPDYFNKYGDLISEIINNPDYVGLNNKDGSIEYVKEITVDNEFVKVAVRVSTNDKYFARSIYALNKNRVNNFIAKGTLIKYEIPLDTE